MQISVRSQTAAQTTLSWQPVAGAAATAFCGATALARPCGSKRQARAGKAFSPSAARRISPITSRCRRWQKTGPCWRKAHPCRPPWAACCSSSWRRCPADLVAVTANTGVFISWRLFKSEVTGHNATGLTGTDFVLYKNGVRLATVTDSTNYLDAQGTSGDTYAVAPLVNGVEGPACRGVKPWQKGYYELPLQKPADGVTPAGGALCLPCQRYECG